MQNKPNVKIGKRGINVARIKDYSHEQRKSTTKVTKNKPNSKPIPQRPKINVNVAFTRNYHNNPALPGHKNKPNFPKTQ
jgi:hypothetical protein